jgi:hypothetical protein
LRVQAQKAGNLKTTEQQTVIVKESAPQTTVIQIEPANPEVVYVPSYNPTVVYGAWAYPTYPPPYWPPPPGYYHPVATGLAAGLAFGAGIAIADSLWGGFDWGHHDVNINVNRYNNINVNNRISGNGNVAWNHNPANRRGTPYRDPGTRQRFNQGLSGAQQREAFRGHDTARDTNRQRAMQSFDRQTGGGAAASARRPGEAGSGTRNPALGNSDRASRPGANGGGIQRQPGASQARTNAFSGVHSPGNAPAQLQRGQGSMQSFGGQRGNVGAGRQVNRQVPARGGFHRH